MSPYLHLPILPQSHSPVQLLILVFIIIIWIHINLKYPPTFRRPGIFTSTFLRMYSNTRIHNLLTYYMTLTRYILIVMPTRITPLWATPVAPNDIACPNRYHILPISKDLPPTTYYIPSQNRIFFLNVANNLAIRLYDYLEDMSFRSHLLTRNDTWGLVTDRSYIFTDSYILPHHSLLCEDAHRSIVVENAGGKSEVSEMYSIDYFAQMYGATNTILETEVDYYYQYKMIDFICTINGRRVGVSVSRGMGYPSPDNFTARTAARVMYKKLYGLVVARDIVVEEQSFSLSILHIWCQNYRIARLLHNAFCNFDPIDYGFNVKGTVLLQLTVCDDSQLYKNFIR